MEKYYFVYKHICPNGKIYIGQTCQKGTRRFGKLGNLYKRCPLFYRAILKYGWDNITHVVISTQLTLKEANWLENYLILYYNSYNKKYGYNLTLGGDGSLGRHLSEEGKLKLRIANLLRFSNELVRLMAIKNSVLRRPVICLDTGETYLSASQAAKLNNFHKDAISRAIRKGRKFKGKTYKYIE